MAARGDQVDADVARQSDKPTATCTSDPLLLRVLPSKQDKDLEAR
jgi:hypothetical protein